MEADMQKMQPGNQLIIWAFATFHAVLFLTVLLLFLYLGGSLGQFLSALNTLVGLGLFAALWLTTWYTTREGWRRLQWDISRTPNYARMLGLGMIWGGVNGTMFLGVLDLLFIGGLVLSALQSQAGRPIGEALYDLGAGPLFAVCVGTPVAFVVGAAAGLLLAGIDALMVAIAAPRGGDQSHA
jgi:hypothetical protein